MADRGAAAETAEAARMQAGIRAWLLRTTRDGGRSLREMSAPALLALVCAGALAPMLAVGAGVTGAVAVAGVGMLSSVGSGALTEVIIGAIDRLRPRRGHGPLSQAELEGEIARQLEQVLARQDAEARGMRAEIASLLAGIDAGGTVLRTAIESGNEQLRTDVIAALDTLSAGFTELHFLLTDVRQSAADIQQRLDEQSAEVRVVIQQNAQQSTDIRLARAELAALRTGRPAAAAPGILPARWGDGSPYRGLLPFGEDDTDIFYGRERVTAELAVLMSDQATRGGVLVVTGASGAGKSSLLRAGLLPALAQGVQVTGSAGWPRAVLTPTGDPLTELAAHLAALDGSDTSTIRGGLAEHPDQAHLAVHQAVLASQFRAGRAAGTAAARLVLVVDQFEQAFTLAPQLAGEASRAAFITALQAAATRPAGSAGLPPALVIVVVRGDFCDRCAAYPELAHSLQHSQFVVGPMSEAELRLAITGPAQAAGLHVDADLTDLILADLRTQYTGGAAGALPLLSQAMLRTWENRDGDRLTVHGYGQAGGVSGAVQASADGVYRKLAPSQQRLAREIFQSMTVVSQDGRLSRRPVSRADLSAFGGANQTETDQILEAFAAQRLVVLDSGSAQIAHDVLLTAWPTLRSWLEDDQASWIRHSQLAGDASTWAGQGHDPSYLYRGAQLVTLRQAAAAWSASPDRYPALTSTQQDFLAASNRAAARTTQWRRILAGVVVVLFLGSLAGAGVAVAAARSAEQQRNLAVSNQLAAESLALDDADPLTAGQLAAAAWQIAHTPQAYESLLQVFAQPERAVLPTGSAGHTAAVFSPNGHILVTASLSLRWWNAATHRLIGAAASLTEAPFSGVAFSPGGSLLATADEDGTAQLWDNRTHRPVGPAITVPGGVNSVVFSPDGRLLATEGDDGMARLWNVHTRREIGSPMRASVGRYLAFHTDDAVAFSPNGQVLATAGGNGPARLWNVQSQRQIGAVMTVPGGVTSVAFSPDGHLLAAVGGDNTARLWNVHTQRQIGGPMTIGAGFTNGVLAVGAVTFSPDGRLLATAAGDGTARLWSVASHAQLGEAMLASVGGDAVSVAFSPDGRILATGGYDGTARLWDISAFQQIGEPLPTGHDVEAVAFRPGGRTLATASFDGTTQLWDTAAHRPAGSPMAGSKDVDSAVLSADGGVVVTEASLVTILTPWNIADRRRISAPVTPKPAATSLALSPDGRVLAIGQEDGQVQLWSVAAHRRLGAPLGARLSVGTGSNITSLAFGSSGRMLAVARGGQVRLWDVRTHRPIGPVIRAGAALTAMALSPDGQRLATAGQDGTVRLWNLTTFGQIGLPLPAAQHVASLAFSPNGRLLATSGGEGIARLWDTATDHQIGPALIATARGLVQSVAFSPDGDVLATGADDGTARLWDVAIPRHLLGVVCSIAGRALTRAQWAAYAPTEPYQPVCASGRAP